MVPPVLKIKGFDELTTMVLLSAHFASQLTRWHKDTPGERNGFFNSSPQLTASQSMGESAKVHAVCFLSHLIPLDL